MNENQNKSTNQDDIKSILTKDHEFDVIASDMQENYSPTPEEVFDHCIRSANHTLEMSEKTLHQTIWDNKDELVLYITAAYQSMDMIVTPDEKTKKIFDDTVGKAMRGETRFEKEFEIVEDVENKQSFVIIRPRMRGAIDYMGYSIRQIEEDQFNVYKHGTWPDENLAFCGSGNSVDACMGMLHDHWIKDDDDKHTEEFLETSLKDAAEVEESERRAVELSREMVTNELDPKRPKMMLVDDESEQEIPSDDEGFSDHQEGQEEEM